MSATASQDAPLTITSVLPPGVQDGANPGADVRCNLFPDDTLDAPSAPTPASMGATSSAPTPAVLPPLEELAEDNGETLEEAEVLDDEFVQFLENLDISHLDSNEEHAELPKMTRE